MTKTALKTNELAASIILTALSNLEYEGLLAIDSESTHQQLSDRIVEALVKDGRIWLYQSRKGSTSAIDASTNIITPETAPAMSQQVPEPAPETITPEPEPIVEEPVSARALADIAGVEPDPVEPKFSKAKSTGSGKAKAGRKGRR